MNLSTQSNGRDSVSNFYPPSRSLIDSIQFQSEDLAIVKYTAVWHAFRVAKKFPEVSPLISNGKQGRLTRSTESHLEYYISLLKHFQAAVQKNDQLLMKPDAHEILSSYIRSAVPLPPLWQIMLTYRDYQLDMHKWMVEKFVAMYLKDSRDPSKWDSTDEEDDAHED